MNKIDDYINGLERFLIENDTIEKYEADRGMIAISFVSELLRYLNQRKQQDKMIEYRFKELKDTNETLNKQIEDMTEKNVINPYKNILTLDINSVFGADIDYMTDYGVKNIKIGGKNGT